MKRFNFSQSFPQFLTMGNEELKVPTTEPNVNVILRLEGRSRQISRYDYLLVNIIIMILYNRVPISMVIFRLIAENTVARTKLKYIEISRSLTDFFLYTTYECPML